ncbi:hypothetical protein ACG1BZ_19245 [Microbulbifer sp. CNSA002]|uniref:hypothetical protein n=1 Tax=Microbulbifer sp. CNSA002 TaxID=3373604 RepID=UPI0039B6DACF
MYLLLSGEGPGDIGVCNPSDDNCDRSEFSEGPMAIMVDQLVEHYLGYEMSHLGTERVSYVSERYLAKNKQPPQKKKMSLRGKKKAVETKYYYENARALAAVARVKREKEKDNVVAVLFRDSDGTASAGRGEWRDKRKSILAGFAAEGYELGVAMIPKPKSEAWLLCAVKDNPYQHCEHLENESGNDCAQNPLKTQLDNALDNNSSTHAVNERVRNKEINAELIDMPSLNVFKEDLRQAVLRACNT